MHQKKQKKRKKKHPFFLFFTLLFSFFSFSTLYATLYPQSAYADLFHTYTENFIDYWKLYFKKAISVGTLSRVPLLDTSEENYFVASTELEYRNNMAAGAMLENYAVWQTLPSPYEANNSFPDFTYYSQLDEKWSNAIYGGTDTIGVYGCGPTVLASVVATLKDAPETPLTMAKWAFQNGYFSPHSGSYHSLIPDGASSFGLDVRSLSADNPEAFLSDLAEERLIVVLMNRGHFTSSGHFIILRGLAENGKIYISDSISIENSLKQWELQTILQEAKIGSGAGGPFWSIGIK